MKAIDLLYTISKTNIDNRDYFESANGSVLFHDFIEYYMTSLMKYLSSNNALSVDLMNEVIVNSATANDISICLKKSFHLLRLVSKSEDNKGIFI